MMLPFPRNQPQLTDTTTGTEQEERRGRKTSRLAANESAQLRGYLLHGSSDAATYRAAPEGLGSIEKNEQLGVGELGSLQTLHL